MSDSFAPQSPKKNWTHFWPGDARQFLPVKTSKSAWLQPLHIFQSWVWSENTHILMLYFWIENATSTTFCTTNILLCLCLLPLSLFLSYISSRLSLLLPPPLHSSQITSSLSPSLFLSVLLAVVIYGLTGDLSGSVELFLPLCFILLYFFLSPVSHRLPLSVSFYLFLRDSSPPFTYFVFLSLMYGDVLSNQNRLNQNI